jgi:hypothetical protein
MQDEFERTNKTPMTALVDVLIHARAHFLRGSESLEPAAARGQASLDE